MVKAGNLQVERIIWCHMLVLWIPPLEEHFKHSSTVAMSNYEKTSTREFENSLVEPQQQMSERWIEIINLPTDLTCIADFVPDVRLQESVLH